MQFFALCAYFVITLFWRAADYWGVKFSNTCNFILNSAAKSKKSAFTASAANADLIKICSFLPTLLL